VFCYIEGVVTDPNAKTLLITRRRPVVDAATEEVLRQLAELGLDIYTTRQRLTGLGMLHLDSGPRQLLQQRAAVLERGGYRSWIVTPTTPQVPVERLLGLDHAGGELHLRTQNGLHVLRPGMQAVGVLAELTGALEAKLANRIHTNHLYRGTAGVAFDEKEIRRTIFLNTPVFDLYLIDGDSVRACIRVYPGRFDPKGLGAEAGVSSKANLQLLIRQVAAVASPFALHTHFGLSQLPGSRPVRKGDDPDWKLKTLRNLTRFGWLMVDIALQPQQHAADASAPGVGAVAAAALLGRPMLGTTVQTAGDPGVRPLADVIDAALAEEDQARPAPTPTAPELPQPPLPPDSPRFSLRMIFSAVAALTIFGASHLHSFRFIQSFGASFGRMLWTGIGNGLLPGVASLALFALGINRFRLKRLIENTPTSRIRSLAMGLVEVHGHARRKYALVAPMTQSPCVWYRLRTYRRQGDAWRLISDVHSGHVPFLLEDATGRVTVDPSRARMKAGQHREGIGDQASMLFGVGTDNEKWVEETISEGEALYVLGSAATLKNGRKSLHEKKLERLRELKTDRSALLQNFDSNGDGRIDEDEWQAARETIEEQVVREHLAEKVGAQTTEETTVIGRSPHRSHPFVIAATRSEAHLTRTYSWLSSLQLAGSLIFFVWTIVAVFRYVG